MCAEQGVEMLRERVGLVPPRLSLSGEVQAKCELRREVVVASEGEGVLGHEGHVVALVVLAFIEPGDIGVDTNIVQLYNIIVKFRTRIAVGGVPVELSAEGLAAQGKLQAAGVALSCIHHHTTVVIVWHHDGELLVANLHVE